MLNIYKASAGSGKTFALTKEYFRIIFTAPAEYRNILAVTFTNKATEEMKSRIINELHRLAEGAENDYGKELKEELGFSDDQLQDLAKRLRTTLLHDYGRFSVTTIDRFFQRMIKSFTKELGIFPGYNVELDSDFVLLKAVDKVIQKAKADTNLWAWIRELVHDNVDEGRSWSIKTKITGLGEELFKENYMLFDKQMLDKFGDKSFLKEYQAFLRNIITTYEQQLTKLSNEALHIILDNGLELNDFKNKERGCAAHFYKIAARNFDKPTATARKAIDNPDMWYTTDSIYKTRIESIFPVLNKSLKETIGLFDTQHIYYQSAKHIVDNLYQLGILNDLCQEIRAYCNERGVMLLSDTTHILNLLIANNDTPFLFEKTGNYYKHVMIDEFQDTSLMQWRNFKPLIINSLSEGNRAMIVGDVKQSIYRWRNGEWGLLAYGVEQEFGYMGYDNVVLENNWRSALNIVFFNNIFFEKAVEVLKNRYNQDISEEKSCRAEKITVAYDRLRQIPQKQKAGYVDVRFGLDKKEKESDEWIMEEVATIINDIILRKGQPKDIVILVRTGKEGAFVANFLMEYNKKTDRPINFISNDSLYVWSSPYIKFIIAVLQYIMEPYDMVNRATILYYYNTHIKNCNTNDLHHIFKEVQQEDLFQFMEAGFDMNADKMMSYSLFETVEVIIDRFSLNTKQEEVPYLIAFQDIIFEYETANPNSLMLFLEWWEKEQHKKVLSTSEEVNAVRILTIHKSKGLEFEYVILPFCNWELDPVRPARCIWCSNHIAGFDRLEYAPLTYSSKLVDTIYKDDYYEEHLKTYIDNLNLLYVALTRAKSELYIRPYMPKLDKSGTVSITDIGAFIHVVLAALKDDSKGEYIIGDVCLQWGEKKILSHSVADDRDVINLDNYPVYELGDRVSIKYRFRDYCEPEDYGLSAVDEGKLLHEIFKSIAYINDIAPAVQYAYLSGLISGKERNSYVEKITAYLTQPEVAGWFDPRNKVINERDILFPSAVKVRPDRVVQAGDSIQVIDYKFGQVEEENYLKQVRFYCNTLRKMGCQNVKGYLWYVKLEKVVLV